MLKDHIKDKHVNILPNAQSVKMYATDYFNWNGEKDDRGRKLLLDITNAGYNYDPYFWEKKTHNIMRVCKDFIVIPDWRYYSTYKYFREKGFEVITVKIINPNREITNNAKLQADISENGLDDFCFDYEIINDGSLNHLEYMAKDLAYSLLEEVKCS